MAQVKIYTSPTCIHCKAAKAYFKENNITYEEYDVMSDPAARQELLDKGYRGVPVINIDGQDIVGFDRKKVEEALGRA